MNAPDEKQDSPQRKGLPRRLLLFWGFTAFLWAVYAWWTWWPPTQERVEDLYSGGAYRVFVAVITPLTAWFPYSFSLILVVSILLGFPMLWAANWGYRRRVLGFSHWRGFLWGVRWGIFLGGFLLCWFLLLWGAGYQRLPVEKRMALDISNVQPEEAEELRAALLEIVHRDLPKPEEKQPGPAIAAIAVAMGDVIEAWEHRPIVLPPRVKATPKGLLLMNGTSGICSPLTLEPHVDGGLPDTVFVAVAAHELSHIAGICSEAEANLFGYVSGLRADNPYARYAVALDLYRDFARQLNRDEYKAAMDLLPKEALDDLLKAQEAAEKYRIKWLREVSWKFYNRYLQSRGIKDGVKNYARGVSLFTFAWRKGLVDFHGGEAGEAIREAPSSPAE